LDREVIAFPMHSADEEQLAILHGHISNLIELIAFVEQGAESLPAHRRPETNGLAIELRTILASSVRLRDEIAAPTER
jgi:hypothetical protein